MLGCDSRPPASPPPAPPEFDGETGRGRALVIIRPTATASQALCDAVGLSAFDIAQRVRREGHWLLAIRPDAEAREEAARLTALNLTVFTVPEPEARRAPLAVTAVSREDATLVMRTAQGTRRVTPGSVVLVVEGPITRAPQTRERRVDIARPEHGYRFHLHLENPPALELDPGSVQLDGVGVGGSSLLVLRSWVRALGNAVPVDDGFRHEEPALAPSAPERVGPGALVAGLESVSGERPRTQILDNLKQFRFYSAWHGAVARAGGR